MSGFSRDREEHAIGEAYSRAFPKMFESAGHTVSPSLSHSNTEVCPCAVIFERDAMGRILPR
jgi:hypothetical protein